MISIEDLRRIYLLQNLSDEMLGRILPMVHAHNFDNGEVVFEEGERADNFYMLKRGKILLEVEITEAIIISLGSIKSGYSFGWSSLIPGSSYTSYAVCSEACDVLSVPGNSFLGLLHQDHTMGYIIMEGVIKILKNRLERRTGQYLKVMSKHPDIQKLLGLK
jgi:CRP-like cAMP-binding protein